MTRATLLVTALAAAAVTALAVIPGSTANATTGYHVFNTGIGIYPRTAPTMNPAARTGTALADGTTLSIACQTTGEPMHGNAIYNRLADGTYLPDYFTYTGVDGFVPALPRCDTPPARPQNPQPQAPQPRPFGAACAPTILLAVPGSIETSTSARSDQHRGLLAHVTRPLADRLGGKLRVHYVNYPAKLDGGYFASKDAGYRAAWSALNTYAAACPASTFALLGYSQGAHIAGDLAATIGKESSPVLAQRLTAVVLLADPARNPGDNTLGTSFPSIGAAGARNGFGDATKAVIGLCTDFDPVCNAAPPYAAPLTAALLGQAAHTSYATRKLDGSKTFTGWLADYLAVTLN
ncbi:cutinase family protein [Amycolatopsis sp. cmx-4-54]|uniref:cutinase family protein n=1 Tax=Amycolatopsis sp. cmx-4-54 TaxID=2790936 RepID=UPI00397CB8B4